jgi:hypothetical protein
MDTEAICCSVSCMKLYRTTRRHIAVYGTLQNRSFWGLKSKEEGILRNQFIFSKIYREERKGIQENLLAIQSQVHDNRLSPIVLLTLPSQVVNINFVLCLISKEEILFSSM